MMVGEKKSGLINKERRNIHNSSKIVLILILGVILISGIGEVQAATAVAYYNTTNYANIIAFAMTADTGTATAYTGTGDGANPPTFSQVFGGSGGSDSYNLTTNGYTYISAVDGSYAVASSTTPNDEPFLYSNYTIQEEGILWVNVTMVQNQISGTDQNCNFLVANWSSEQFVPFGASMSGTTDVRRYYNYSGSNLTHIIDSATKLLTIVSGGQQSDADEGCNINYMGVVVGYTVYTYPQFSNYGGTANNTPYTSGGSYVFNVTVTDTNGTAWLQFNGANYSATNVSSLYTVTLSNRAAGNYDYIWWAWGNGTDRGLNNSQTPRTYGIAQNAEKVYTLFNTSSPINYPIAFTVYSNATPAFVIYRNGTTVSNASLQGLAAGTYNFTTIRTDKTNYSDVYNEQTFQVNKATDACGVVFNTTSPVAYPASFKVWHNCTTTATLYRNGSVISNNSEQTLAAGTYNFTVIRTDKSNYTNYYDEENFQVDKATLTASLTNDKAWDRTYDGTANAIGYSESNSGDGDVSYLIYRNGTNMGSSTTQSAAGVYAYVLNTTGGVNYSASASLDAQTLVINKSETALGITGTTPIMYGTTSDFSGTGCPGGLSCSMNASNQVYGVGTIVFNYSTAGNENYTANWTIKNLVVNQNNEKVYTLFNTSSPVTYPVAFSVYSNATPAFTIYRNGTTVSNDSLQGLAAGTYNFTTIRTDKVNYSDVYNEQTFQVNRATDACGVVFNTTSPVTYPASFKVWHNCTTTATLYRNGSVISNNSDQGLTAGTYNFTVIRADTANYTNYYDERNFVVSKATTALSITGTSPITYGTTSDFAGTNCPAQLTGSCSMNASNQIYGVGTIVFNYSTAGNENYTANWTIKNLVVNQNPQKVYTLFNTTSPINYPVAFTVYSNATPAFTIYRNGTTVSNDSLQGLAAGTYNFTTIRTDKVNYSDVYNEQTFIVSKATTALSITGTTPIIYGTTSDFTGNNCPAQLSGSCLMNASNQIYGVGTIVFNYSTAGNENYTSNWTIKNLVVNVNTESFNIFTNTTSPVMYPTAFTVYSNSTSVFTLYRNGTTITNASVQGLAVGTYNFTIIRTDQVNYSNVINTTTFRVNQNPQKVYTLFNTTSPINYPVAFTVYSNATPVFTIYRNGTSVGNASAQELAVGTYNFTTIRTDKVNYSDVYNEQTFRVNQVGLTASLTNDKAWDRTYDGTANAIGYSESNSGDGDVSYLIYRNGTNMGSSTTQSAAGAYAYVLNSTGGVNYSASANLDSRTLTINRATDTCGVLFNETSPINYGTTFAVWSNCTSGIVLYRNGTVIGNNSPQNLAAGTYNFTVIRNDTQNYTNIYEERNFVVGQASSSCDVFFNQTSPLFLGITFSVWSNCDSDFTLYRNGTVVFNNSPQNLPVGVYNFTVIRTDQISYTDIYDEKNFVIWSPSKSILLSGINNRLKIGTNSRLRILQ